MEIWDGFISEMGDAGVAGGGRDIVGGIYVMAQELVYL